MDHHDLPLTSCRRATYSSRADFLQIHFTLTITLPTPLHSHYIAIKRGSRLQYNHHTCIRCSLLQESKGTCDHLMLTFFSFTHIGSTCRPYAFSVAGPTLWNSLPGSLLSFRRHYKIILRFTENPSQHTCQPEMTKNNRDFWPVPQSYSILTA